MNQFQNIDVIKEINITLSACFNDYKGSYFYGSRAHGKYKDDSDLDIALIFEELNFDKKLTIAGALGDIEYKFDIFIDYRLFTTLGKRGIEYIRANVNPLFIHEAIDKGIYYERT
jgi:predicted nucleotidyltransferase